MNAIDSLDTGAVMARIASMRIVGPSSLEINWAEGSRTGRIDIVDLSPAIKSYKAYRPLRDNPRQFAKACLIDNGDVIAWEELGLDMSAELIETLAEDIMTSEEFAAFLKRHKLTQDAAAALLGRSRRQIGYYLTSGLVPRIVALACAGYEAKVARHTAEAA